MTGPVVIIGNGMVGSRLAGEIAAAAPGLPVTVIGAERRPAYNRVLLSSLLAGGVGADDLALPVAPGAVVSTGVAATAIDRENRAVILADGSRVSYGHLVLATGSQAVRLPKPGFDLPGVVTFRDWDDVTTLQDAARRGGRAVVIGGGLLGIEAADGLARSGMAVTLVHIMDRLMERQLDAAGAALIAHALRAKGITVDLSADSVAVTGEARTEGLVLADGRTLPADLVVCAVGVRPEVSLARAAGLAVGRGVIVDDHLATSDPMISAVGECAEHAGLCYGLVEPGYEQARVLARRLVGDGTACYAGSVVATHLKVSGLAVFSAGDFLGRTGSEDITVSDPAEGMYRRLVLEGGRLVGAVLVGDTADAGWYGDLIRTGRDVSTLRDRVAFGRGFAEAAEAA